MVMKVNERAIRKQEIQAKEKERAVWRNERKLRQEKEDTVFCF